MAVSLEPIGTVVGGRQEAIDDDWGEERAVVALDEARFNAEAFEGLDAFSHVEVIFHFHQVAEDRVQYAARHPRGNTDWPKIGIFAQRGKARPNRIGLTVCRLVAVDGTRIEVEGLDAIDGTPVLDIKPYMRDFAPRGVIREPEWAGELMAGYW